VARCAKLNKFGGQETAATDAMQLHITLVDNSKADDQERLQLAETR
jgi:hypothetical protein